MIFQSPGAEIFTIGPITLRWYGLLIATGFYLALQYASSLIQKRSHAKYKSVEDFQNFAFIALLGGIVGARTWFVILDWDYFSQNLLEAPQIWLGGISIQGGLIGGTLTALLLCFKDLKKMLFYLSALASAIPLAQAIGRWGNFFNEEAFGRISDLPWKLYISHTGTYHHPTFLYESILNLAIFGILFAYNRFFYQTETKHDLRLIGLYFFFYSFIRFFLESIRTDSLLLGGYPAAQILAITGVFLGIAFFGVTVVSRESK
jgi:phosphatidylglycerol---prolipoprotein diacylglyceryl transferase